MQKTKAVTFAPAKSTKFEEAKNDHYSWKMDLEDIELIIDQEQAKLSNLKTKMLRTERKHNQYAGNTKIMMENAKRNAKKENEPLMNK